MITAWSSVGGCCRRVLTRAPVLGDPGSLASRSRRCLLAFEEAEDGLVGRHEDGGEEIDVVTLAADLSSGLDGSAGGVSHRLFGHPGPVALDQVASRPVTLRHSKSLAPPGAGRNRVFPYVREGGDPVNLAVAS